MHNSKTISMTLDDKIADVLSDDFGGLSKREEAIGQRAELKARIQAVNELLEFRQDLTTESWRHIMRNVLSDLVDRYYQQYA